MEPTLNTLKLVINIEPSLLINYNQNLKMIKQ